MKAFWQAAATAAVCLAGTASADETADLLALLSRSPQITGAPEPKFERLHQIQVGSSETNGLRTGYSVGATKTTLRKTSATGVMSYDMNGLTRGVSLFNPGTPQAKLVDSETIFKNRGVQALGGLVLLPVATESQSKTLGNAIEWRYTRFDVEGNLFPLEVGKKLKVRFAVHNVNRNSGMAPNESDSEREVEFVVMDKTAELEQDGFRIDGGVARIEETTTSLYKSNDQFKSNTAVKATRYFSEKYGWVVAHQSNTSYSFGMNSVGKSMPVYVLDSTSNAGVAAELARYDRQLIEIQRSTAAQYLNPRVEALAALAGRPRTESLANQSPAGPAAPSALAAFECSSTIKSAVTRTLIGYGLSALAERADDLAVKSMAQAGAQQVGKCGF